jgi:hypothetical protein
MKEGERAMKNVFLTTMAIGLLILSLSACTLHVPTHWGWDEGGVYRIILKVDPDDAEVLLNGKLIGYAYEFSSSDSAIELASRNNELVIKKDGYEEEAINLYEYGTRRITIRLKLVKDRDYRAPRAPRVPRPPAKAKKPAKPKPPKVKPEYKAKKVPPKTPPQEAETVETTTFTAKPVNVTLHILPDEAAIYLDGKFWGLSPKSGVIENLRLKPGKYTLEIVKPGYHTYVKKLSLADKAVKLIIKLDKK